MLDSPYVVGVGSSFMQNPKKHYIEVVWWILRYMKGTLDFSLIYKRGDTCKMVGYYDADYAHGHDMQW